MSKSRHVAGNEFSKKSYSDKENFVIRYLSTLCVSRSILLGEWVSAKNKRSQVLHPCLTGNFLIGIMD